MCFFFRGVELRDDGLDFSDSGIFEFWFYNGICLVSFWVGLRVVVVIYIFLKGYVNFFIGFKF